MTAPTSETTHEFALIVGGYGLVGNLIAQRLRARHPTLPIAIGGRSIEKAATCAGRLTLAKAVRIDVADVDPLASITPLPAIVVGAVNDINDQLMMSCVRRGIAFVDITRWSDRVIGAVLRLTAQPMTAPVILSSGWMAGAVATATTSTATRFKEIDSIKIDILFALADAAGPDSLAAADRLTAPISTWVDGENQTTLPFTSARRVRFANNYVTNTYRYDIPDQTTAAFALNARRVESRVNYDSPWPMRLLRPLLAAGIWRLLETPYLEGLRRALIYSPGPGARHEVRVEIAGRSSDGMPRRSVVTLIDPKGQAHMTASGAVDQIERCLGLNGRDRPAIGVSFPEHVSDPLAGVQALREMGVLVDEITV